MARSKSDIANSAIRIFLQDVGRFYDTARGFEAFVPKKAQKEELLEFFNSKCCFCGIEINIQTLSQDHLIPMNKTHLGLHAWGNVVPCCGPCNNSKQQRAWKDFLVQVASEDERLVRTRLIEEFVASKKYDPQLNLHQYADNLYEDVGEVAMTLIQLRYKHAEKAIEALLESS
jgi:5-methylcytosine-specific restriction endonuclease McrA